MLRWVKNYAHEESYINALSNSIKRHRENSQISSEVLLFSFHGLPKRYITLGDPYQRECEATAKRVTEKLGLKDHQWRLSYQSRVGKEEWLGPYTDTMLKRLGSEGTRDIDVVCPAFATDCLETLEEIAIENKAVFLDAGGRSYEYIAALNDSAEHIEVLAELVTRQLVGW